METPRPAGPRPAGRVLIVDDEPEILGGYERALRAGGFEVLSAANGREAIVQLEAGRLDAIISDVVMPDMDGLRMLRAVRERDLDVPVILVSGSPTAAAAQKAVEYGALLYLVKPVPMRQIVEIADHACRLVRVARVRREAAGPDGVGGMLVGDRAGLEVSFERGLKRLWMAYQPIIRWSTGAIHSQEALLRTGEAIFTGPGEILGAAERLHRISELGRLIRAAVALDVSRAPGMQAFVNLHPRDLCDDDLFAPDSPLSRIARRVVLEVTERAPLDDIDSLSDRVAALRDLGFRLAIDDMGAGYSGLSTFTRLRPEVAKIDMFLVRGVDADPTRRKLIRAMTRMCTDLGVDVVAEGIETAAECDAVVDLGCDLLQGYLFAQPARPPVSSWTRKR